MRYSPTLSSPASSLVSVVFLFLFVFFAQSSQASMAAHSIKVEPNMKTKISEKTLAEVTRFFDDAETAISKGDLEMLMGLYSESYKNEDHDKAAAREIWKRMFDTFEDMGTMHNMRLLNYSPEGNLVVIGCSGILLGKKKMDGDKMPLDTWTNEEHILTLENGKWKLVGSAGIKRKRLWFDKPMHPLF